MTLWQATIPLPQLFLGFHRYLRKHCFSVPFQRFVFGLIWNRCFRIFYMKVGNLLNVIVFLTQLILWCLFLYGLPHAHPLKKYMELHIWHAYAWYIHACRHFHAHKHRLIKSIWGVHVSSIFTYPRIMLHVSTCLLWMAFKKFISHPRWNIIRSLSS